MLRLGELIYPLPPENDAIELLWGATQVMLTSYGWEMRKTHGAAWPHLQPQPGGGPHHQQHRVTLEGAQRHEIAQQPRLRPAVRNGAGPFNTAGPLRLQPAASFSFSWLLGG